MRDGILVEMRDSSGGQGCNLFDPLSICCSCVRRRRGCGVPSARHGALRYVRIIQHAYTVIQFTHYQPSDRDPRVDTAQGRDRVGSFARRVNRETERIDGEHHPTSTKPLEASSNREVRFYSGRDFPRPFLLIHRFFSGAIIICPFCRRRRIYHRAFGDCCTRRYFVIVETRPKGVYC